ncbi:serine O-acetyltransferase [Pareuzebyella sediminis]|uniref:serine O-acetyltransferase n=1 Tax=Pareuzebyella sediminis TaxID=2607998 RepID=UPI0011F0637C|nr:serine acetyltransferase [Pareuzebyella sediminis]
MKNIIKADLFRYGGLKGTTGFIKGILVPGFRYVYLMRRLSKCRKPSILWFVFTILKRRYTYKYGFEISKNTEIGEGFYIGHFGGVVINPKAIIGKNFTITHGVTIGQANRGKQKGCPTIGDNVWIGTGSVVVGKINVGNNVLIAPNTFVNIDIPEDSIVIGSPCKIINKKNPCDGYIQYVLEP